MSVLADSDADEREGSVIQEIDQRLKYSQGVDELEDEAAAANAELQNGDGVRVSVNEVRTPLNVETDDERAEAAALELKDIGDPNVDHGRRGSEEFIVVESDVVIVVRE